MEQQNSVSSQIDKEEKKNVYLSSVLKSLQEKLAKAKSAPEKNISIENRAELQIAQMKTLDKKIEMYRIQLERLNKVKTSNIVKELRTVQQEIKAKQQDLSQLNGQLFTLQEETKKMRDKNLGYIKNKQMQKTYEERQYQMKNLEKKLKQLSIVESNRNFISPLKSKSRTQSQIMKQKDTINSQKNQIDNRKKIDKYAVYKNLIRFYKAEELKLKNQIQDIIKKKLESANQNIKINKIQNKITEKIIEESEVIQN